MKQRYSRPLTMEELANLPDEDIDCSDIPELDAAFWATAKLYPPRTKPNVSLRIPQDVVEYFKSEYPRGYTSQMAAVLSAYVHSRQVATESEATAPR